MGVDLRFIHSYSGNFGDTGVVGRDRTHRQSCQHGKLLGKRAGVRLKAQALEFELGRRQLRLQ